MRKKQKYVLKHMKTKLFLEYIVDIDLKHYIPYINKATVFENKTECRKMLNKLKHPENWEIKGVN